MKTQYLAAAGAAALAANPAAAADCGGCFCIPSDGGTGPCPSWLPQTDFPPSLIAGLQTMTLLNPYDSLTCNPYTDSSCVTSPPQEYVSLSSAVCAFVYSDVSCTSYSLQTFPSSLHATSAGATVTHNGACGLCSTAKDLAVYIEKPDMTSAGKVCSAKALLSVEWGKKCYEELGFTEPCAAIWNYDGMKDASECKWTCLKNIFAPENGPAPECALNDCLQCDEDEAGPVFKDVAGRTRRRSGLDSSIARGCDEFAMITHELCPTTGGDEEASEM